MWSLLIRNTSLVHTLEDARGLSRAVVGVESGRVTYLGPQDGIPSGAVGPGTEVLDAHGGFVGPGFV
ncbi:MAG: imidazolonepropionase, partial [Myxococcaceae bacterium]|nr:imidazolonepropionase [Myxococcaceae bacterium]